MMFITNFPSSQLRNRSSDQAGFSLIELMISIALGIFFGTVALSFIATSSSTLTTQDVGSRIQENGRFAVDELTQAIRMAGYYNLALPTSEVPNGQFYLGACGAWDPCTADGAGSNPDRVAVLINPAPDDGTDQDCTGALVNADPVIAAKSVVANVYFVADDASGVSSLQCQAYLIDSSDQATVIGDAQVLVSGVDNMQIQYGVSNIVAAGQVDTTTERYLSASALSALPAPDGGTTPWVDLKAVQFAFLVNSGLDDETFNESSQAYTLFDAAEETYSDSIVRETLTGTVLINNAR